EWDSLRPISRREAYYCDITYGTNHEFGFDYLRDNMAFREEDLRQRELNYAIVDEVDSILIDEARTPLIISGPSQRSSDMYYKMDKLVRRLNPNTDYTIDEKAKTAMLTEEGIRKVEDMTGCGNLSDPENLEINQYINSALKAHTIFIRDKDYVVKDGQVIIVDEFTGRLMFGRRWSDGLHQAVEAKEGCKIQQENQTLATITYQNYFRLYSKLAGMTGTALTEEDEFRKIYALDVVEIPTNRPVMRNDMPDVIYKTEEGKFRGLILEILAAHAREQPVLVGTRSIEVSERVSQRLSPVMLQLLAGSTLIRAYLDSNKSIAGDIKDKIHRQLDGDLAAIGISGLKAIAKNVGYNLDITSNEQIEEFAKHINVKPFGYDKLKESLINGIKHNILNAKYHEQEAEIISQAGRRGAVTIATNMAGRGVDIILGGVDFDNDNDNNLPEEELKPIKDEDIHWDFKKWCELNPDKFKSATPKALEVIKRGGLCVIGSERHESRRIDNQLRGRSGRQGDPGSSKFFVSLEDELWRLFGDKSNSFLLSGWREDQALDAKLLSRMIEKAQKKVEMHHFEARKNVLQYDDVMNVQRETIYSQRRKILQGIDLRPTVIGNMADIIEYSLDLFCPAVFSADQWDIDGLYNHLNDIFPLQLYASVDDLKKKNREQILDMLNEIVEKSYQAKEEQIGVELMRQIERHVALDLINRKWIDHLDAMDFLREGINLRGYAQKDPVIEYKKEAYDLFQAMLGSLKEDMVKILYRIETKEPPKRRPTPVRVVESAAIGPQGISGDSASPANLLPPERKKAEKIGRNDPCPCGSGKKYKKCCGI
ncbi:MAG: SEC-C metal-binding domain-containing protein, partial [Armatimonadota bacterium]